MSGVKSQILWSPNHVDKFVTYGGSELSLYKVARSQDPSPKIPGGRSQAIRLSEDTYASLVSSIADIPVKCVAWYPRADPEDVLAVGQSNGRIVLTSFSSISGGEYSILGKEFVPRHSRICNSLSWNQAKPNMLAVGLDKVRSDVSLLVWDISAKTVVVETGMGQDRAYSRQMSTGKQSPGNYGSGMNGGVIHRPFTELGTSETTLSLGWSTPDTLIAGQGYKFIRTFDLRDSSKLPSSVVTKAVFGVTFDAHLEHRFATFTEGSPGVIYVWDLRRFEKPVLIINTPKAISEIAWSPKRFDLLACLGKDDSAIQLYDVQHTLQASTGFGSTAEDNDPAVIDRWIQFPSKLPISWFSWHPSHENRMITISQTGTMQDMTIFERISMDWSPNSQMVWGCGKHFISCAQRDSNNVLEEDISVKMKKRALAGYGTELTKVEDICSLVDEPQIVKLWQWINRMKLLMEQGRYKSLKYHGVRSFISGDQLIAGSGKKTESPYTEKKLVSTVHYSEERWLALQMCGWEFDTGSGSSLKYFLTQLEARGEYERAAAVALFNGKIRTAIKILSSDENPSGEKMVKRPAKDPSLNMVAMALAGYSDESSSNLWRDMCRTLFSKLENPYLRAAFAFLTTSGNSFDSIIYDNDLEVEDRVAFACKYLPDNKLNQFLETLSYSLIKTGNLSGILLTGITTEGLTLLESYVNRTADIQSACLAIINCLPNDVSKDPRVAVWTESYRGLLDVWRLWHQRAKFDIFWRNQETSYRCPAQMSVSCNFCGNPILTNMITAGARIRRIAAHGTPANRTKIMSCPACRKPLPRCSICLINMGTPSTYIKRPTPAEISAATEKDSGSKTVNPFVNWFSWCQTCRHGGHAGHLLEWFGEHSECAVTGCSCHCMSLDAVSSLTSKSSES